MKHTEKYQILPWRRLAEKKLWHKEGPPGAGNTQVPPLLWTVLYPSGQLRHLFWFLWIIIPHSQHKYHHPSDHPQMALSLLTLIILPHLSYLLHSISIPNPYKQGLKSLEVKVVFPITVQTCLPEFPTDLSNVWLFSINVPHQTFSVSSPWSCTWIPLVTKLKMFITLSLLPPWHATGYASQWSCNWFLSCAFHLLASNSLKWFLLLSSLFDWSQTPPIESIPWHDV